MEPIFFVDRSTGKTLEEKVYFKEIIHLLYGKSFLSRILGWPIASLVSRFSLFSALFGWWNKQPFTKSKIRPFIQRYGIDESEFLEPAESFPSFNSFFIRKLKPECRPIEQAPGTAVLPADARYLFYQDIGKEDGFLVKGETFSLHELLRDDPVASRYQNGAMAIARLCPTDYHRYHFPVDCIPSKPRLINGFLYSVNPVAIKEDIHIFSKNKRVITTLSSDEFGEVLFIEVGATNVGSINQTYRPGDKYQKGDEKGYFSFGASTLLLLFEPGRIQFDQDLLNASEKRMEIFCRMGQRMGKMKSSH